MIKWDELSEEWKPMIKDKLSEDKRFLRSLGKNISNNMHSNATTLVTQRLSNEVESALDFLDMREEFWRQLELSSIRQNALQ